MNSATIYEQTSPLGERMRLPDHATEDEHSFEVGAAHDATSYLRENGYVVIRGIVDEADCDRVCETFASEVKQSHGAIGRIGGTAEVNRIDQYGFMLNPIMNIQVSPPGYFDRYIAATLAALTHDNVRTFLSLIQGPRIRLLTCNHFEANPETVLHQDSYFWGELEIGDIVGLWLALEDIDPRAGAFYVYAGSHRLDVAAEARASGFGSDVLDPWSSDYHKLIVSGLQREALPCRAPCLRKGDVVFYDSRTIHGSLATIDPSRSRSSFTAHFCPEPPPAACIGYTGPCREHNGIVVTGLERDLEIETTTIQG